MIRNYLRSGTFGAPEIRQCEKHGPYEACNLSLFGIAWSKCPTCQADAAAVARAEREQRQAEEAKVRWLNTMQQAGIPERFRDRTLDNYEAASPGQQKALEWAKDYAYNFTEVLETGRSMLLLGRPGTGKTHLGCAIAQHLLLKGSTAYYSTVQRALRRIKDTWSRDSHETEAEAIRAMTGPDLLVLDEIGVQFGSDTEKNLTFDLLNERYERRKPTLLLSNLAKEDVAKFLGERVMDRLREDGGRVITFDWDSHRRKP